MPQACKLKCAAPCVILSDERSEESNFCGMEYPSRSRIRNRAKARSGICAGHLNVCLTFELIFLVLLSVFSVPTAYCRM